MRRWAVACLVLALVAGCSDTEVPSDSADVIVSGDPGIAPTVTYETPLQVSSTRVEQVWPGTGPAVIDGSPVLLDFWLENADTATLIKESYSGSPVPITLSVEAMGEDLYTTISGQHVGARLAQISPPHDGVDHATVTVIDILPTVAGGEAIDPNPALPVVTDDGTNGPVVTPTGTEPPPELVQQPLIKGTGNQVAAGDVVTVQYTAVAWDGGAPFDTTWTTRMPRSFPLATVPAWSEGLVEQTVGSRVLLIVPPRYGMAAGQREDLAGQTFVFVIDILASRPDTVAATLVEDGS